MAERKMRRNLKKCMNVTTPSTFTKWSKKLSGTESWRAQHIERKILLDIKRKLVRWKEYVQQSFEDDRCKTSKQEPVVIVSEEKI